MKYLPLIISFFISSLFTSITNAQVESVVVGGATTAVVVDKFKKDLNNVIDNAMDRADYSIAKAGIEALGIIEAWEKANSNLLDQAFQKLDEQSRNILSRTSILVTEANLAIENNLESARQITENIGQILENIPFGDEESYVLRYEPKVINPKEDKAILVRLRGINLDKSEMRIVLPDGSSAESMVINRQEINFWLPISRLNNASEKSFRNQVRVFHKTKVGTNWLFQDIFEEVERTMFFVSLPSQVGTYDISGIRLTHKEERFMHRTDVGIFKGYNKTVLKLAKPPTGYLWDLRKGLPSRNEYSLFQGHGEKGRCEIIAWNGASEHGISVQARVDRIRQNFRWKDGYVNCSLNGPVYRILPHEAPMDSNSGQLRWNEQKLISLPPDIKSYQMTIRTYDNRVIVVTESYRDNLIEVVKTGNSLVIRSFIPKDVL